VKLNVVRSQPEIVSVWTFDSVPRRRGSRTQPGVSTPGDTPQRRALTRRYYVAPSGKTPGAPGLEVLKGGKKTTLNRARLALQTELMFVH
jgi:hypothetical protein